MEGKKPRIKTNPYQKLLTSHGFKASKEAVKPTIQQRISFAKPIARYRPENINQCSSAYSTKKGAVHQLRLMILCRYCNLKSTQ